MASAKNEDREIIELARIQFGEDTNLFDGIMFLRELVAALLRFAEDHPDRAVGVRMFMDQHELHYWDKEHKLPRILKRNSTLDARDRDFGDDELDDWTRTKRDERRLAQPLRMYRSFWAWIRRKLS